MRADRTTWRLASARYDGAEPEGGRRLLPRNTVHKRIQRRAREALAKTQRPLFVCKGNVCRSPFAAEVWASSSTVACCSAGHYPIPARSSPAAAIEAAKLFGVDLSSHRSRTLDRDLIQWADAILIFDREQESWFHDRCPEALDRVHYFGALDEGPIEVPDPFGGNVETFAAVYRRIRDAISAALPPLPTPSLRRHPSGNNQLQ